MKVKKLILKLWPCSFYESNLPLLLVGPHCFAAEKSAIALYFGAAPAILHSVDVKEQSQQTLGDAQQELNSSAFLGFVGKLNECGFYSCTRVGKNYAGILKK